MTKLASLERQRSTTAAAVASAISYTEPTAKKAPDKAPASLADSAQAIERITITIPVSLLEEVDARLARLGRRERVSLSGYIEAGLRELLAAGESDLEVLARHAITKRRRSKSAGLLKTS